MWAMRSESEPGMFAADGYHPSAAGYAAAAEVLLPAVCGALDRAPSQAPNRAPNQVSDHAPEADAA